MASPRHILLTGAAGAIGASLARAFTRRHPGAALSLVDVAEAPLRALADSLGAAARPHVWDLTRLDALPEAWRALRDERGPVDVLVNCAGVMDILTLGGTGWTRGSLLLAVNLLAPLRLMDLALADLPGGGHIVNVSSMAGRVPLKGCAYYGAAKAGLAMASEIARLELGPRGVRVLTVYPGPVASALEAHARGQVARGVVSKFIPTGTPDALADRILSAMERDAARVVYPGVYGAAYTLDAVARRVSAAVGPDPLH